MKSFKQHICEKLKVSSKSGYTLFPKTKEELKEMIENEMYKDDHPILGGIGAQYKDMFIREESEEDDSE